MPAVTAPGGTTVGLEQLWPLVVLPVAAVAFWYLLFRRREGTSASTRSRWALFGSRLVIVALLVVAAAGPYTVTTRETAGDPHVTMLVDESDSMAVSPSVADRLASDVEDTGVPVSQTTVADGRTSRIGDGIAANLRENGTVVVVSDGQVTRGRRLQSVADRAAELNATISSVSPTPTSLERHVSIAGPAKTSVGVESRFVVRVDGVQTAGSPARLSVEVDGQPVASPTLREGTGTVEVSHTFEEVGSHEVTATLAGDDEFDRNDVYRKSVRVVERPKVLYISRGNYSLRRYLEKLYEVETARSVPENLDGYYAVVVQDVAAADVGRVDRLQKFVIDGNGLVVVGGEHAYENGDYSSSSLSSMLPVRMGEGSGGQSNIVLLVDVSGSSERGMEVQKAVSLNVLDQLGDRNRVGIVGFNWNAYDVADLQKLRSSREELGTKIRRLESGGATEIAVGLKGAEDQFGDRRGTVLLISDGHDEGTKATTVARQLGADGIRVIAVGTGPDPKERTLRRVAEASGGSYLRAGETDRLRLLFGGSSRQFQGDKLTVVDRNHFVTAGVELESSPGSANEVSVKRGADYLVATSEGEPAVAAWRYGLGRVVSVTAYGERGGLDGLLRRPDSLVVTQSVNYAIGDPERKSTGVTAIADTRVGEETAVEYRGESRPAAADAEFRKVGERTYRATVTPNRTGFHDVAGATYAANTPREYSSFGPSSELEAAVETTGGRTFSANQAAEIASFARQRAHRVRQVRRSWTWLFALLAFLLFLAEVFGRRVRVYRGDARNESGLS